MSGGHISTMLSILKNNRRAKRKMFDSYKDYESIPNRKKKIFKLKYKRTSKDKLKKIREEIKHENSLLVRKQIIITAIVIILTAILIIIII